MMLTRITAIATAAALVAASLPAVETDEADGVHTTIDTFWVDLVPYEQPCEDLPVFTFNPPSGADFFDWENWIVWANVHRQDVEKEKELGKSVDTAQRTMILNTVNHLRYVAAREDPAKANWALGQKWRYTFLYYKALYEQFAHSWESRKRVRSRYFSWFIRFFPTFTEQQQQEALDAFDKRMDCLQVARRRAFATIQEQRKKYAEHLAEFRSEQLSPTAGSTVVDDEETDEQIFVPSERALEEAGRAAMAVIALTNAERAYLWLVAETTLNIDIYSKLLQQREDYLTNTMLHELRVDTYRANPDLGPHEQPPIGTRMIDVREEIFKVRARRAVLHLYLEDQQLEAGFRRSTSWLQSSLGAMRNARDNARRVWNGLNRNPNWQIENGTTVADAGVFVLGSFAVLFKLGGDLLNVSVIQPLVDATKDSIIKPIFNPWGLGVQNSIEKAYDDYWKTRRRLDERIRLLRRLDRNFDGGQASAFVEWARTAQEPTPESTGLRDDTKQAITSLLEDGFFVEATGGLPHIFAALTENPGDLTALYVTGAYFHQRGNAKAGASRLAVNRAVRDVATGDGELGREIVERIINPLGRLEVDADAGYFANWAYLAWELPTTVAIDLVWNAPTQVKLLVAYNTHGNPINQDEYLRGLQTRQAEINNLRTILAASSFDYDRMAERQLSGYLLHMGLLETSHEYCGAYRKIRADFWEREKQWIWAKHENEHSRTRGEQPPRLSATGIWAESDTAAQEDMEMARLAFKEGVLRAQFLAYTGAYAAAAGQLRELEPVAAAYYTAHSKKDELAALPASFADQIEFMEAEAGREEAVAIYDGLYKTVVTETAVSLVSTRLVNSMMGRAEGAGRAAFNPEPPTSGWSAAQTRIWQTLNPWAGKFSQAGVKNVLKNAAIQGFRESVSQVLAESQINQYYIGLSEQSIDAALDFLFSVAEETVEDYADKLAAADIDREADPELYRARYEATKQLDQELNRVEEDMRRAGSDEERQRFEAEAAGLRALRTLITGDTRDPEVVEAALSQLSKLNGELLRDQVQGDVSKKVVGDDGSLDVDAIPEEAKTVLRLGMRDRLHSQAVTTYDIRRLLDPDRSLNLSDQLFKDNQFDIQTLRHAMVRAAVNDPQRSVELLACAMALDQRRAQITESLVDQLVQDPRFAGKVTVLRESNRVAVIGADPSRRGDLDAPGIFVDREYDVVIREGADVDPHQVRAALDELLAREGYAPTEREGARNGLGARFHFQSEAEIRERGRKSGRRALVADEYLKATAVGDEQSDDQRIREEDEKPRLPDPGKRPSDLSDEEARRLGHFDSQENLESWKRTMETERGFKAEHAWHMHLMAQLYNAIIVVRNGNPDSLKYVGLDGYIPKDMSCKAKSARVPPHEGLVVNPRHDFQAKQWEKAIREAESPAKADELRYHQKRAEEAWDKYGEKMFAGDYAEDAQGVIIKRMPDGTWSKGIHGDYDLHEVFVQGPDGRWVRVSFGDGSEADNALRSGFRAQFNEALGAPLDMYLHGGQGDWDHPGKTSDPPVTIFAPNSVAQATGVRSGYLAKNAEELRDVFENKLGTGWAYSDGHGDLGTPDEPQGIYWDRLFQSVGGNRWQQNRDIFGVEQPPKDLAGNPLNNATPLPVPGWVTIPMWQAYGLAVDLLPRLDYLADPAFEAASIENLANDYERTERLEGALRRVDGFLDLVEAWLISQPKGNSIYNEARPEWLQAGAKGDWQQLLATSAPTAPAATTDAQLDQLAGAARKLVSGPLASSGSHRVQLLREVQIVNSKPGVHSLFAGGDYETLKQLVSAAEVGARLDPFSAIGGRTPQGVARAIALIDWMRNKAAAMYADIGVSFVVEYQRMILDGTSVEEQYAPQEAKRISLQLELAAMSFPDLVLAFARPPFSLVDGRPVAAETSTLRAAIFADQRAVLDARRAAAEARRAGGQPGTAGNAAAAFTTAASGGREQELGARAAAWDRLARSTRGR